MYSQKETDEGVKKYLKLLLMLSDIPQIWSLLRQYVMHDLCEDNPPNPNDQAFHWTMISQQ